MLVSNVNWPIWIWYLVNNLFIKWALLSILQMHNSQRTWGFLFHSHFLIKTVSKSENVKNPYIANTLGKINIWWNKTKSLISIVNNTKDKVNTNEKDFLIKSWSFTRFPLYCSIVDKNLNPTNTQEIFSKNQLSN